MVMLVMRGLSLKKCIAKLSGLRSWQILLKRFPPTPELPPSRSLGRHGKTALLTNRMYRDFRHDAVSQRIT
jgi:hypothetical protein